MYRDGKIVRGGWDIVNRRGVGFVSRVIGDDCCTVHEGVAAIGNQDESYAVKAGWYVEKFCERYLRGVCVCVF